MFETQAEGFWKHKLTILETQTEGSWKHKLTILETQTEEYEAAD